MGLFYTWQDFKCLFLFLVPEMIMHIPSHQLFLKMNNKNFWILFLAATLKNNKEEITYCKS